MRPSRADKAPECSLSPREDNAAFAGRGRAAQNSRLRCYEVAVYFKRVRPVFEHQPDANQSRLSRRQPWLNPP